jgi:hypothetical protein
MMHVDLEIISAAAHLIAVDIESLPCEEDAEWRGFDEEDAKTYQALLSEITWADLIPAVRSAADRLPEPTDDEDEDA